MTKRGRTEVWRVDAEGQQRLGTVSGDVRGVSGDASCAFALAEGGLQTVDLTSGTVGTVEWPADLRDPRRPVRVEVLAISTDGCQVAAFKDRGGIVDRVSLLTTATSEPPPTRSAPRAQGTPSRGGVR